MEAFAVFAVASAAIALVFVSWALFRMTRFPPGFLLVVLGFVLSSVGSSMPGGFREIIDLSVPILLGTVLFGCGLRMNAAGIGKNLRSLLLSLVVLVLTIAVLGLLSMSVLGTTLWESMLIGVLCVSLCSFFGFSVIRALNIVPGIADSLLLEGTITESASILLAFLVLGQITGNAPVGQAIVFGALFGLLIGIVWVRLVRFASDFPYKDLLTLSLGLGLIAFCEMVFPKSGYIGALFFGLTMGNAMLLKSKTSITGLLKLQGDTVMAGGTFFFFYLGLLGAKMDSGLVFFGAALWFCAFVVRAVVTYALFRGRGFSLPVVGLSIKGLSTVLIAQASLAEGLGIGERLFAFALPLVLLSGLAAGISSVMLEGRRPKDVEEVAYLGTSEKPIKHAYDINELKRTIEK